MILEVLAIFNFVFTSIAIVLSIYNLIEVKAMQKSTHQIQYVPLDDQSEDISLAKVYGLDKEDQKDAFSNDFDNIV